MPYDYLIPLIIFFIALIGCGYSLINNAPKVYISIALLVVCFIPKYDFMNKPYYGTEYEDAYVFQADSKSVNEHMSRADRFRIQIENYDFENEREDLLSYNGHFTTYSSVIALGNKVLGYSQFRTIQFNLIFSLILSLIILNSVFVKSKNIPASLIAIFIFASSPAINLFQTSGLAETFSSLMIATFIGLLFQFWKIKIEDKMVIFFMIITLFMCMLIKRENMVLLSTLPLIVYQLNKIQKIKWLWLIGFGLLAYFFGVQPFSTEFLEAESIKTSTFSLSYLTIQLPAYITTLMNFQYFGVGFIVMLITYLLLFIMKKKPSFEAVTSTIILLGYLTIYCLHYRSRYFVISMEMSDFETFRYANNFFFLIPLIIGFNLSSLWDKTKVKWTTYLITASFFTIFAVSISYSKNLRNVLYFSELESRISPILEASKIIDSAGLYKNDLVLITDIPLVAKMLDVNDFNLKVHDFKVGFDYTLSKKKSRLYFLIPQNLVAESFPIETVINYYPLTKDSHYVLFQLSN
jgi:hypothetical protein